MNKVLVFGSTGNLGRSISKELKDRGFDLTVVARNKNKAPQLSSITSNCIQADITDPGSLAGICKGFDTVISSLGKSVSLNDKSKPGFTAIDLDANSAILEEAIKSGVKKFVYVSAFHAEQYLHLTYFRVHHEFAEKLKHSGLNYSIIKPPAIFSAFVDLIPMARKGQLVTIGKGDKRTNPIYEGDLAKVCVDSIALDNSVIEAGGKNVYTRSQLNEIIQRTVCPEKKIRNIPAGLLRVSLPLMRIFNKNTFDKFAFFFEVMQHDTIAPKVGEMRFEDYIKGKAGL
jgi:uncharacterized protein YbjT (DUF2867 family)